jgi:DNA-binding NarL/FixJ family response regulator
MMPTRSDAATLRIVLADDHETVRTGLRVILDAQPDMEVVAEATEGHIAVELACRLVPDVMVIVSTDSRPPRC